MEQSNKYYIPDISEFHVGFEYEWTDGYTGEWTKEVVDSTTDLRYFREDADVEHRVKYLDREDIESLGFIYIKHNNEYSSFQLLSDNTEDFYELEFYCEDYNNEIWIEKFEANKNGTYNSYYIFKGVIKNKSELQKLLKMLGIDGD